MKVTLAGLGAVAVICVLSFSAQATESSNNGVLAGAKGGGTYQLAQPFPPGPGPGPFGPGGPGPFGPGGPGPFFAPPFAPPPPAPWWRPPPPLFMPPPPAG